MFLESARDYVFIFWLCRVSYYYIMEYYRGFKIGGYALSDDEEAELSRLEAMQRPILVYGNFTGGNDAGMTASTLEDDVREMFSKSGSNQQITIETSHADDSGNMESELMMMLEDDEGASDFTLSEAIAKETEEGFTLEDAVEDYTMNDFQLQAFIDA